MKPLKDFNEFVKEGVVKKQSMDKSRAISLMKESKKSYEFLKNLPINDKSANIIIKNVYDTIMELIRAKMLIKGFNSIGKGAHEAEVSYLRKLKIKESEVQFTNQLRYFRNGIMYYGKSFNVSYTKKVLEF